MKGRAHEHGVDLVRGRLGPEYKRFGLRDAIKRAWVARETGSWDAEESPGAFFDSEIIPFALPFLPDLYRVSTQGGWIYVHCIEVVDRANVKRRKLKALADFWWRCDANSIDFTVSCCDLYGNGWHELSLAEMYFDPDVFDVAKDGAGSPLRYIETRVA